jgi:xylulokinase
VSLLAVDIGSSTCKALVFATDGQVLAQHRVSYAPEFPRPGFAEMEPEKFWNAVSTCSRSVAKNLPHPVQAVCFSSHGETFVAVDSHGRPVMNAILNQDGRATLESLWCEDKIGRERLFQITGLFAHPMYPVPKILWLRKHNPDVFSSTSCFLSLIGYLLQKMRLPPYVDYSLASRFLAFDIRKRSWSDEILSAVELDKDCLPVPAPAGAVVGKLSSDIANELGVSCGTPVVLGGHDQPCGALGTGVVSAGRVADSMGTYECLLAASETPTLSQSALRSSLNSYCHAYFPAGIMVRWFHDLLYSNSSQGPLAEPDPHAAQSDHYAFLEAHAPAGPTGLNITPHLIGTCNPEFNPHARGFIAGLGPGTDRVHLYKGILEGLACELSIVAETLSEAVGDFADIYATGGGTRSALGLRLRAALTGRRVHIMRRQESVCLGTAILAGVAIGEYAIVDEAIRALVEDSTIVVPDRGLAASYQEQMKRYRQLRSALVGQT